MVTKNVQDMLNDIFKTFTKANYYTDDVDKSNIDLNSEHVEYHCDKSTPETIDVLIDAPGCAADSFDISIKDNTGYIKTVCVKWSRKYTNAARKFYSTFNVQSDTFDLENVKASYKNGVLTISLPKIKKSEDKKISVTVT